MEKQEDEIFCPECGKINKKDAYFCRNCSNPLKAKTDLPEEVKELKEDKKQCPICKMNVPKEAMVCPYCKNDLSVAGNLGKILSAVGGILVICVTIPIILFSCGMCSLGSF